MATASDPQTTVKVEVYVPQQVRDWLDQQGAAVYKGRSGYIRDLLVELWRKDVTR